MPVSSQPSERIAVVGTIDPQTVMNTELFTDVVDMKHFHECMGIALLGNMAAETIDFAVYTCDSDGNNATELKDITQLAAHATNNDNKQVIINVKSQDLASANKRYVKFGLVTGSNTGGPAAVVALGVSPRYAPGTDNDLNTVVEIVTE